MKLVIVLIGVTFVLGKQIDFNGCHYNEWSCDYTKYEITYKCYDNDQIFFNLEWKDFYANKFTRLTIHDCFHFEIIFKERFLNPITPTPTLVINNVTNLYIFHEESTSSIIQIPYNLYVSDVANIRFENLVKPHIEIFSLVLNNVYISGINNSWFFNLRTPILRMKNVVIGKIDSKMFIVANVTITGTIFPLIPNNGIELRAENISLVNNTFRTIHTDGLIIKSRELKFSDNYVYEVKSQGLNLLGTKIQITKNVFIHLETEAFQSITPGFILNTKDYEIGFKFALIFTENIIKNINPGSIHFNWKIYKKTCADLQYKNNVFDCSCLNFGWIGMLNSLGPKLFSLKEFYDIYHYGEDNYCSNQDHCPINAVISQIQDVCNNKTNISMACSLFNSSTEPITLTYLDDVKMAVSNVQGERSDKQMFLTKQIEVTEKIIPVFSYSENQTSHLESRGFPVWFIVIPLTVLLTAISTGLFLSWYKKKKQGHMIITSYRNESGAEADDIVMINEHQNELYNKQ